MQEILKIAICDDRDEERKIFLSYLTKYFDLNFYNAEITQFSSGEKMLNAGELKYDLIILDIIMGELNGIETASKIREKGCPAQIIFCSTTKEFAADSYDVAALHYLIKPVSEEKFFAILDTFFFAHKAMKTIKYKKDRLEETVLVSDILWIETGKNHKNIIHTKQSDEVTRTSLSELLSQLQGADFVLPIRWAAVNLESVVTLPTDVMKLSDGTEIKISREKKDEMKKAFTNYKMKTLLKK